MLARGQEDVQPVITRSSLELNFAQSLWFNSSNAAGMALNPLRNYNILSAQYENTAGDYNLQQEGDRNRSMGFSTNGALQLGKFFLWGAFHFADNYVTGATYNTNRYEPQADMPYYVADPNKSDWKKQCYDMMLKVALPVWKEHLMAGFEVQYTTKRAAKQLDPRSTVYGYGIVVKPSVVMKITNRQHAGISLWYRNTFDRNNFTNSLTYHSEPVYIMKGLGNYAPGVVGPGGIGIFYYPGNLYGGGLQYGISTNRNALLLDITGVKQKTEAFENPTKPQRQGTADNTTLQGTLQLIRSGNMTHKMTAEATLSNTDGVEYVQEYDSRYEANRWVTIAQYVKSRYRSIQASMKYDLYVGTRYDYSWKAGLKTCYIDRQDKYLSPRSTFNVQNNYTELSAVKNLTVGTSSKILVGWNFGYNLNLGGEYLYGGTETDAPPVTDFYPRDLACLTANYWSAGCELMWSYTLEVRSSIHLYLSGQWQNPDNISSGRLFVKAGMSYIF
jgi:hypothetical protein